MPVPPVQAEVTREAKPEHVPFGNDEAFAEPYTFKS